MDYELRQRFNEALKERDAKLNNNPHTKADDELVNRHKLFMEKIKNITNDIESHKVKMQKLKTTHAKKRDLIIIGSIIFVILLVCCPSIIIILFACYFALILLWIGWQFLKLCTLGMFGKL
jgi:hypothetical protein